MSEVKQKQRMSKKDKAVKRQKTEREAARMSLKSLNEEFTEMQLEKEEEENIEWEEDIVKKLVMLNYPNFEVLSMEEEERFDALEGQLRVVINQCLGLKNPGLVRGKSDEVGWQYVGQMRLRTWLEVQWGNLRSCMQIWAERKTYDSWGEEIVEEDEEFEEDDEEFEERRTRP
jgi:hypothetical protein